MPSTWANDNSQIVNQSSFNCPKDRTWFMHGLHESGWHCLLQQRETTWADQTLRIHQVWTSNPRNQTKMPIPGADHLLRIKLPIPAQEHWKLTHHQASCLSTAVDAPAPLNFILLSSRLPDFLSSASLIPLMEELEHGREAACSHLIKATSIHTPRAELRTELC